MKIYILIIVLFFCFSGKSQNSAWYDYNNSPLPFAALIDEVEFIDSTTWMYSKLNNSIISYKNDNWSFITSSSCPTLVTVGDIWEMEAASEDTLWMCYDVVGIHYYLKSTNIMTQVNNTQGARNMVLDGNDIWFTKGTEHAIYKYDGSSVSSYDYSFTNLPDTFFLDVRKGLNDDIWTITQNELVKYDGSIWTAHNLPVNLSPNTYTTELDIDINGNVWVTVLGKDLMKFDGSSWTTYNTSNSSIPGDQVETLHAASNGDIWIGIRDVGLVRFDGSTFTTIDINTITGWTDNAFNDINEDISGNIWVAPYKNVFVYNPNGLQGYLNIGENLNDALTLYPNPSKSGVYTLSIEGVPFKYKVHSLDGKLLTKGMSTGTINLANQPQGIYILHVTTSGGSIKKMLVIE